ncbi:enoyl-CoA hydratase-related protein [Bacillus sp. WP8]|uniref:enoyl-CoA hydratase-related protein n=1 Tax=Bacillus sp. WP8 TaxID=756828 RepID=UPI00119CE095|nr:enoyl-CoA hydratase-related protein [Bacillus sp. WP8]
MVVGGGGGKGLCCGGEEKVGGDGGYVGEDEIGGVNVLELEGLIGVIGKGVVGMVGGYGMGGGDVLQIVCDVRIGGDNGIFGERGGKVGRFDGGYG